TLAVGGVFRSFEKQLDGPIELLSRALLITCLIGALSFLISLLCFHHRQVRRCRNGDSPILVENKIRCRTVEGDVGRERRWVGGDGDSIGRHPRRRNERHLKPGLLWYRASPKRQENRGVEK